MLSMASCSIGVSNIKLLTFNRVRYIDTNKWNSRSTLVVRNARTYASLVAFRQSDKLRTACSSPSGPDTIAVADTNAADESAEIEPSSSTSQLAPNPAEVESLIADICDTKSIAEFELKLDGFRLYVMRKVTAEESLPAPPPPSPSLAPTYAEPTPNVADSNGSVSSTSLAISKLSPFSDGTPTLFNKAADQGLVILLSPRVGFFRRSRTIKGKRAPPACKEKQIVKEGQVLCYVEQLGGELPIESDVSGEIIKILQEDGDPVGYGDALISILPSFPGI